MIPILSMILVSVVSWLALVLITGGAFEREFAAGMAGPLVVSVANWAVVARTFRTDPARVQPILLHAFAAKVLFFSVYLMLMVRVVGLQPAPFVLSFAACFVALFAMQVEFMRRLFHTGIRSAA
jgi:hypothetical protein